MDNPGFNAITDEQQQQQRQEKTPSEENLTENAEKVRNEGKVVLVYQSCISSPIEVSATLNFS